MRNCMVSDIHIGLASYKKAPMTLKYSPMNRFGSLFTN